LGLPPLDKGPTRRGFLLAFARPQARWFDDHVGERTNANPPKRRRGGASRAGRGVSKGSAAALEGELFGAGVSCRGFLPKEGLGEGLSERGRLLFTCRDQEEGGSSVGRAADRSPPRRRAPTSREAFAVASQRRQSTSTSTTKRVFFDKIGKEDGSPRGRDASDPDQDLASDLGLGAKTEPLSDLDDIDKTIDIPGQRLALRGRLQGESVFLLARSSGGGSASGLTHCPFYTPNTAFSRLGGHSSASRRHPFVRRRPRAAFFASKTGLLGVKDASKIPWEQTKERPRDRGSLRPALPSPNSSENGLPALPKEAKKRPKLPPRERLWETPLPSRQNEVFWERSRGGFRPVSLISSRRVASGRTLWSAFDLENALELKEGR
jgi:hypothetical protein